MISLKLSVIFIHIITLNLVLFLPLPTYHPAGCLKYRLKKLKVNSIFLSKGGIPCKILLSTLIASFSHSHPMLIL